MNKYENVVIVDPKLDEEALSKVIDRFTKLINKHGKVFSVENNGLQELAYEIQKNKDAYYVIFTFESNPDFIEELQRNYRITDEILKFLVIKIDEIVVKEKKEKKTVIKAEKEVEAKTEAEVETKTEAKEETKVETKTKVEEVKAEVKVEEETETEVKTEEKGK